MVIAVVAAIAAPVVEDAITNSLFFCVTNIIL